MGYVEMENTEIDDPEQLFKIKFPNFNVYFIFLILDGI